jgi:hypothetical protein
LLQFFSCFGSILLTFPGCGNRNMRKISIPSILLAEDFNFDDTFFVRCSRSEWNLLILYNE